jgi:hypothetical protein
MRAMKKICFALVLFAAAACSGNKSQPQPTVANAKPAPAAADLEQDLEQICHSMERSGAKPDSGLSEVGPWLEKNVHTTEGKALLEQLKTGSFEETRAQAKQHGVAPCPLLDPSAQAQK